MNLKKNTNCSYCGAKFAEQVIKLYLFMDDLEKYALNQKTLVILLLLINSLECHGTQSVKLLLSDIEERTFYSTDDVVSAINKLTAFGLVSYNAVDASAIITESGKLTKTNDLLKKMPVQSRR